MLQTIFFSLAACWSALSLLDAIPGLRFSCLSIRGSLCELVQEVSSAASLTEGDFSSAVISEGDDIFDDS